MKPGRNAVSGQNVTETVILLPFFLMLVFGVLQMGQLGVGLMVANYAASSIARQAVQDGCTTSGCLNKSRFQQLLTVGMKMDTATLVAKPISSSNGSSLLGNIQVDACAEISAYPFIGQFLGKAISSSLSGSISSCDSLSAFAYSSAPPARFVVHGKAIARMNYRP